MDAILDSTYQRKPSAAKVDTALVILTAGRKDKRRLEDFQIMLSSFSQLSVAPDIAVLFQDWNADPEYAEMLRNDNLNFSFPTQVVDRPPPDERTIVYPRHFYEVHLKMVWWWTINTAFVKLGANQICFFDDDVAIHPSFFAWVKEMRETIPRKEYWGLCASGGTPYMPLCINRFEWSILLRYHQDFCFKEQGSWDIVLFGLHQNGPISKNRATTTTKAAIHLSYSKGNATDKIAEMKKAFSHNLDLQRYHLGTPYYPGFKEPAKFADVNFEDLHEKKNRAFTQTQLLKMIDYCTSVAWNAKSELKVDQRLIPIHIYKETKGTDVQGYTLASFQDNDLYLNQSRTICNMNADCMGFVHVAGKTHFKSNVSSELRRNTGNGRMISLFAKICERVSARNLCIPAFEYIDW